MDRDTRMIIAAGFGYWAAIIGIGILLWCAGALDRMDEYRDRLDPTERGLTAIALAIVVHGWIAGPNQSSSADKVP